MIIITKNNYLKPYNWQFLNGNAYLNAFIGFYGVSTNGDFIMPNSIDAYTLNIWFVNIRR